MLSIRLRDEVAAIRQRFDQAVWQHEFYDRNLEQMALEVQMDPPREATMKQALALRQEANKYFTRQALVDMRLLLAITEADDPAALEKLDE